MGKPSRTDIIREFVAKHGNIGKTAIARKLGFPPGTVSFALHVIKNGEGRRTYERDRKRSGVALDKNRLYAKAYKRARKAGLPLEKCRSIGRIASAQAGAQ